MHYTVHFEIELRIKIQTFYEHRKSCKSGRAIRVGFWPDFEKSLELISSRIQRLQVNFLKS